MPYDYMLDPPDDDIYDPEDVCLDCGENHLDCECAKELDNDDDFVDDSPRDIYDP